MQSFEDEDGMLAAIALAMLGSCWLVQLGGSCELVSGALAGSESNVVSSLVCKVVFQVLGLVVSESSIVASQGCKTVVQLLGSICWWVSNCCSLGVAGLLPQLEAWSQQRSVPWSPFKVISVPVSIQMAPLSING